MGVGRESARTAIQRSIDELNEINDLLSSDAENQVDREERRVKRKNKSSQPHYHGNIYNCKKHQDIFLKELSNELGIDKELQDLTPEHNSPLSSLFSDPDKMKIWLVFVDASEKDQHEMMKPRKEAENNKRYNKISKSIKTELENVPQKTVKELEDVIYNAVSDMGYDTISVFTTTNNCERVAVVAIAQYARLRATSHLPINVVEVEVYKGKCFRKPSVPLSEFLLSRR